MFTNDYFTSREWRDYRQLEAERPEVFRKDPRLEIISDQAAILDFMNRTGRKIGVLYKSPFSMMVVDLVRDPSGALFVYERLLPASYGAVVTVPLYKGQFVLLRQFRHALRGSQLSFPRGFGEAGLSASENAEKELKEEIGAESVTDLSLLGSVTPDSGEMGSCVTVFSCRVDRVTLKKDYEGIDEVLLISEADLKRMIAAGEITDGYTLAAWALYLARRAVSEPL